LLELANIKLLWLLGGRLWKYGLIAIQSDFGPHLAINAVLRHPIKANLLGELEDPTPTPESQATGPCAPLCLVVLAAARS
jgi:hypothetical protein